MSDRLEIAIACSTTALRKLKEIQEDANKTEFPPKAIKLLEIAREMREEYKRWCDGVDEDLGDEIGTSYKNGVSMEYYIESDLIHKLSKALDELEK